MVLTAVVLAAMVLAAVVLAAVVLAVIVLAVVVLAAVVLAAVVLVYWLSWCWPPCCWPPYFWLPGQECPPDSSAVRYLLPPASSQQLCPSLSPPVPLCPDAAEFLERAPLPPADPRTLRP